jgi:hypothetical protein
MLIFKFRFLLITITYQMVSRQQIENWEEKTLNCLKKLSDDMTSVRRMRRIHRQQQPCHDDDDDDDDDNDDEAKSKEGIIEFKLKRGTVKLEFEVVADTNMVVNFRSGVICFSLTMLGISSSGILLNVTDIADSIIEEKVEIEMEIGALKRKEISLAGAKDHAKFFNHLSDNKTSFISEANLVNHTLGQEKSRIVSKFTIKDGEFPKNFLVERSIKDAEALTEVIKIVNIVSLLASINTFL